MPKLNKPAVNISIIFLIIVILILIGIVFIQPARASTIRVPEDQPTIQKAIDAANNGDVVLIAPGTYNEQLEISGKAITLASYYYSTGDEQYITNTVINGNGKTVIAIRPTAGPETTIIGLSLINGDDGIYSSAHQKILHNRFINNGDGLDLTDGSAEIRNNIFQSNTDDGIDLDESSQAIIENNEILDNGNDGIEIRLHNYTGLELTIVIRSNTISGNLEDGIQLIDYDGISSRVFYIEKNLITNNAMAGIGLMDNAETDEDFRGAPIPERIHVTNNTIINNPYGISGGANLIALNNLIVNSNVMGVKNLTGKSVAAHNLFWNNATHYTNSILLQENTLFADPLLATDYHLSSGSPAIDYGTSNFTWNGEVVLDMPASSYWGSAPDLGAFEKDGSQPGTTPTVMVTKTPVPSPSPTITPTPIPSILFAVIGDFGSGDKNEADVAALVRRWKPDFITTVGDNNYPSGAVNTIDINIGRDYHEFIYPYMGSYGVGASINRFFPSLGEHDLETNNGLPYLNYFALPGNERYYDFVRGAAHFFVVNSNPTEPDGTSSTSIQASWLREALSASISTWNIVIFHHSPYSSGKNGSTDYMQWPFNEWGAHAVISGHDHDYERLLINGMPYFVNGLGGGGITNFRKALNESQVRYNKDYGVMLVEADEKWAKFEFRTVGGLIIDTYTLKASPRKTPTPTPTKTIPPISSFQYRQYLPNISNSP